MLDISVEIVPLQQLNWPGMGEDVACWCQECQLCARRKSDPGRGKSDLEQFKVYQPMSVVGINIF